MSKCTSVRIASRIHPDRRAKIRKSTSTLICPIHKALNQKPLRTSNKSLHESKLTNCPNTCQTEHEVTQKVVLTRCTHHKLPHCRHSRQVSRRRYVANLLHSTAVLITHESAPIHRNTIPMNPQQEALYPCRQATATRLSRTEQPKSTTLVHHFSVQ